MTVQFLTPGGVVALATNQQILVTGATQFDRWSFDGENVVHEWQAFRSRRRGWSRCTIAELTQGPGGMPKWQSGSMKWKEAWNAAMANH